MRYFSYDGDGFGFEEHETEECARAAAESAIVYATEDGDGYDESAVDQICYGLILGRAEITNRRDLTDEEQEDHPQWTWIGEPKLVPVDADNPLADVCRLILPALRSLVPSLEAPMRWKLREPIAMIEAALAKAGRLP